MILLQRPRFMLAVAVAFSAAAMADDTPANQADALDMTQVVLPKPGVAHLALTQSIGNGVKFKFDVSATGLNQAQALRLGSNVIPADGRFLPTASATVLELSKSFGAAAMSVALSQTNESNPYLGTQPNGASVFGPRTTTSSVRIAGTVQLAPNWVLAGDAAYGIAPPAGGNGGPAAEASAARANAFSVGVIAADRVAPGDRFSVALSQPPRTYSGTALMDALTGANRNVSDTDDRLMFSMVPLGRAMRVELNYYTPAGRNASAGVRFMVRRNPNDLEGAPATDRILALHYAMQF